MTVGFKKKHGVCEKFSFDNIKIPNERKVQYQESAFPPSMTFVLYSAFSISDTTSISISQGF